MAAVRQVLAFVHTWPFAPSRNERSILQVWQADCLALGSGILIFRGILKLNAKV